MSLQGEMARLHSDIAGFKVGMRRAKRGPCRVCGSRPRDPDDKKMNLMEGMIRAIFRPCDPSEYREDNELDIYLRELPKEHREMLAEDRVDSHRCRSCQRLPSKPATWAEMIREAHEDNDERTPEERAAGAAAYVQHLRDRLPVLIARAERRAANV
jgi:hypothetical protein